MDIFTLRDISKRYFKDMDRLQKYHGIEGIAPHKLAGYIAYWLSKLKPISVINPQMYNRRYSEFSLYINEFYSLYIAAGWIFSFDEIEDIRLNKNWLSAFMYLLKYRATSGDNLEMMFQLIKKHRRD
ncbi:MAG: hypothetical protein LBI27_04790 [Clostridiales bacterium]|nr:hypothetical protein [Clostridiales bacterium]